MLAALDNGVKGDKWFSLMDKVSALRTLRCAWERVRRNRGAAGLDRVSVERFAGHAERYLEELSEQLRTGTYTVQGVRRVYIEKMGGGERPLGIPTVKDRVVQTALKLMLEPIFEREFRAESYGFRPGRGAKDALRQVDGLLQDGYVYVVDADLKSYFDTIPQDRLLALVARRVADGSVLKLLDQYLHQQVVEGAKHWTPIAGTPQGAVLSPLLANLYLHPMDVELGDRYRLVRYADDFVLLCRSAAEAQSALADLRAWVTANGLILHPEKTHVGDCRQPGQGFEFLGYRFEGGRRFVRRKSWQKIRERIRSKTRRTRGDSLSGIVAELNPILRGWYRYFQHAHRRTFPNLDAFVRRRLRAVLCKRQKRPSQGHHRAAHQRWPNRYFAEMGLFTITTVHRAACRPR
jgi:RNA-directed DNA polymerase